MKIYEVINKYIGEREYVKYLEISPNESGTFDKIQCETKEILSDDEVAGFKTRKKFDVIFVDGAHDYEVVKNHLEFALSKVSKNGVIFIHDILPPSEWHTRERAEYNYPQEWCGKNLDVFLDYRKSNFTEEVYLSYSYINVPFGLGVIDTEILVDKVEDELVDFESKIEHIKIIAND